jgi:hypothetical protein
MATKHVIEPFKVLDQNNNPKSGVKEPRVLSASADTIQVENSRKAKALVIFWDGTVDLAPVAGTPPAKQPIVVGGTLVLPVPAATPQGGGGGGVNNGVSAELTLTPAVANRYCTRRFDIVYLDDYEPVDPPPIGAGPSGDDPQIIIVP